MMSATLKFSQAAFTILFLIYSQSALANTFETAAIQRMVELKNDYKKQYGTNYVGTLSRDNLSPTDCFRYARSVLIAGFEAIEEGRHAEAVKRLFEDGGDVAKHLVEEAGWKAYFWSPDVRLPGDGQDQHVFFAMQAESKRRHYYIHTSRYPDKFIPLSGFIVNYNPTTVADFRAVRKSLGFESRPDIKKTKMNSVGIKYVEKLPFCYGITGGARHTFLLSHGKVYEVHYSDYGPTSNAPDDEAAGPPKLYEVSSFKGDFSNYKTRGWLNGVLVCPPDSPSPPKSISIFHKGK